MVWCGVVPLRAPKLSQHMHALVGVFFRQTLHSPRLFSKLNYWIIFEGFLSFLHCINRDSCARFLHVAWSAVVVIADLFPWTKCHIRHTAFVGGLRCCCDIVIPDCDFWCVVSGILKNTTRYLRFDTAFCIVGETYCPGAPRVAHWKSPSKRSTGFPQELHRMRF